MSEKATTLYDIGVFPLVLQFYSKENHMNKETIDAVLNAPHIATAKIFSFDSLSGSCRLQGAIGYEVGTQDRLHVRVLSSDGPGKFNKCWWSLADIEQALSKVPENEPFKTNVMSMAFANRSVNSMYYVVGLLVHCQLLKRADPIELGYVRNTPVDFLTELQALIQAQVDLLPPSMDQGGGPMVVTIPKAPKPSKKSAAPAAHG